MECAVKKQWPSVKDEHGEACIVRHITISVSWNWRVAVAVVDPHIGIASMIKIEHIRVAFVLPPLAQLTVPLARENVKELFVLHSEQREEILVAEMAFER